MKFPRKLSKERLSLLSPEDRKIYEYEHSGLCPEMKQLQESKKKKRIYNDEGNIVPNICSKCGGKVVLKINYLIFINKKRIRICQHSNSLLYF